ncbi:protease modulator HflK [Vallitalea guaymasensis]|uniref:protease modulator HflK n=1 Tax=Vallitalea guaymasensis TaxID=1185412 RepID=UPI00272DC584|nr:protease modulator HflK [Vallitalea guaymasensis]
MSDNFNSNKEDVIDVKFNKLKKNAKRSVTLVVIVLILVFVGFNSVYMLDNRESAVVLRFGQVQQVVSKAGLHVKVPIADTVRKVPTGKVFKMEYGFKTAQSGTKNTNPEYITANDEARVIVDGSNNNASLIMLNLIIQYKIDDPRNYLFKVDDVEGTLRLALEDVVRNSYQTFTLDDARTNKEIIDDVILPELQQKVRNYEAGIEIMTVETQNVELLPAVEEAYRQKENANQYMKGKLEEAEKYNNTIIPQAQAEAQQLEEEAFGYKAEVTANAKAGVAQYEALYEEYKVNPLIVKEKYYIESMRDFITNNNIILDNTNDSDIYKFYNLEDDNYIKQQVSSKDN